MGNGTFWGCDSVAFIDNCCYSGTTLGNYVINVYYASPPPHDTMVFWGRYFAAASFGIFRGNNEAVVLMNAVKAYSGSAHGWIYPLCAPGDSVTANGTSSDGNYWGNNVCQNISYALSHYANTHMPGSQVLHVFLDIESTLSSNFWLGWSNAVFFYGYGGGTPYYECAYLNPSLTLTGSGTSICSYLASVEGGQNTCYGVWSDEPETVSGNCSSPGPSWQPNTCGTTPPIKGWQYSQYPYVCSAGYVDLDESNPNITGPYGNGECDYMIYCA